MTTIRKITIGVMAGSLTALIAYDVFAVSMGGYQATISWIIWTASHQYPVIPLGAGILMGHLFWTQESSK